MKEHNIIDLFNKQAIHGSKIQRKVSRSLVESINRQYTCTWKKKVRNGFSYDGNMYMGQGDCNFSHYFQGCFTKDNEPHFLQTKIAEINLKHNIGTEAGWRIKDTLIYDSNVIETNDIEGLNNGHYQQCMFALTTSSYIIQYILNTRGWTVRKKVYLGNTSFSHLNYDNQWENFVVKSKHNPDEGRTDTRFYFALFQAAPFRFKAVFSITEQIFGKIKDAFVINGMVVILTNNFYSFYNLYEMLDKNQFYNCDFGDTVPTELNIQNLGFPDGLVVGEYPYGLPVNTVIKSIPTVLFQISSKNINGLSFGGFPWYCIGTHYETSKLYSVSTGEKLNTLQHGKYAFATLDDEKKAYFHSDRSGRILCIEYDEIKCLKILDDDEKSTNRTVTFETCYSLQYGQKLIQQHRPQAKHSRSGRRYKPIISQDCTALPSEIVHALDYDNTLDILVVLYTRIGDRGTCNKYAVSLYGNLSGKEIRTFDLNTEVADNDGYDWNIFFNDLMIICTMRCVGSGRSVDNVFTYHICENQFLSSR